MIGEDNADAAGLVAKMDALVKATPNLKAYVVYLGGADVRAAIEGFAADKGIKIPLTIPKSEADTVKRLKVNPDALSTVMLYKGKKVLYNVADLSADAFSDVTDAAKKATKE